MNRLAAALVAPALLAVPATASPGLTGTAEVTRNSARTARIVVQDSVWRCAEHRCAGPVEPRPTALMRACRDIARAAGPVLSFTANGEAFDDEALKRCNRSAF